MNHWHVHSVALPPPPHDCWNRPQQPPGTLHGRTAALSSISIFLKLSYFEPPLLRLLDFLYLLLPPAVAHLPQINFKSLRRNPMSPTASCYKTGWSDSAQVFSVSLGFWLLWRHRSPSIVHLDCSGYSSNTADPLKGHASAARPLFYLLPLVQNIRHYQLFLY